MAPSRGILVSNFILLNPYEIGRDGRLHLTQEKEA